MGTAIYARQPIREGAESKARELEGTDTVKGRGSGQDISRDRGKKHKWRGPRPTQGFTQKKGEEERREREIRNSFAIVVKKEKEKLASIIYGTIYFSIFLWYEVDMKGCTVTSRRDTEVARMTSNDDRFITAIIRSYKGSNQQADA